MNRKFSIYPVRIDSKNQAWELLRAHGVWRKGIEIMVPKSQHLAIKVGPVSAQAAQVLKQEMLSKGGEAATHWEVLKGRSNTSVFLFGTIAQYRKLLPKLKLQPFRLPLLAKELEVVLDNLEAEEKVRPLKSGGREIIIGRRTLVMGILNVTPDSFSDGGSYTDPQAAVDRALEIEEQGADILDIGAESTRPGFEPVPADEELARLLPVLDRVAEKVKIPISIDTYKSSTAMAALEHGASIINDISGGGDSSMHSTVAKYDVPMILMHCERETTSDIMEGLIFTLKQKKEKAMEAGIREEQIILDPGIGFAKTVKENLDIINRLDALKALGCPVLIGTSRKSVIGKVLNVPPQERLHGTSATVTAAILRGAGIVRVHDVKEMVQVARMTDAIMGRSETL